MAMVVRKYVAEKKQGSRKCTDMLYVQPQQKEVVFLVFRHFVPLLKVLSTALLFTDHQVIK